MVFSERTGRSGPASIRKRKEIETKKRTRFNLGDSLVNTGERTDQSVLNSEVHGRKGEKNIDLAHTIDQYNRLRAPYFRDFHPSTIALLDFVLARNPISVIPRIPESWPVDRSKLNNAVKEFHKDVSHLGNCEEFRKWERALAQRSPNAKIPAKPLGFRKGSGKDSLFFPTNFASDFRNTRL
jgi:hypothetical protein